MAADTAVSVSESPVSMVTPLESWIDMLNVPDVDAVQNERSVSTSPLVPAHEPHPGWLLAETDPPEGEPQVTGCRVLTVDTFAVPADPGSPV